MPYKILVVDDSKVARLFVCNFLREQHTDLELFEAGSGDEALQLAVKHQFHGASLDFNMPNMNGLELATQLQQSQQKCFIGLLTANVQRSMQQQVQDAGLGYYKKPVNPDVVKQLLIDMERFHAAS
ncbi:hypothetical protein GCM10009092_29070 [Bowmanella denitrificans]|uniref:Response regulatory domain-containing protein n=1 Tax=Bowmanella denitrificans TaxID=366582 RepID=A0ABN0XFG8_9ALTE|nr:response regulator [Bowmanella denitrificans]